MTPSGIYQMIERRGSAVGITGLHPHVLRHSWAHFMKVAQMSDDEIMRLLAGGRRRCWHGMPPRPLANGHETPHDGWHLVTGYKPNLRKWNGRPRFFDREARRLPLTRVLDTFESAAWTSLRGRNPKGPFIDEMP